MSVMESLVTRRTYRRFAQKPVPQDETGAGILPAAEGKEAQE